MGTKTKYSDLGKPAELLQSELCKVKTYKIAYKKIQRFQNDLK